MKTLYGDLTFNQNVLAQNVKLLVCDIDGVFSDGRIYLGNNGEELKAFHTKDGFGVKALIASGVDVAVITGRKSKIVQDRMASLNVRHIIQGQEDKLPALIELATTLNLVAEDIAFIGDDIPDVACINWSGFGLSVQDGHPYVKGQADYVTQTRGGFGAVREICDIIMQAQGNLSSASGASI